jgi:PIN domain nuclease of toxin-antitoxin system
MILLLDTCALLWFLSNDPQLSPTVKKAIEDPANVRWVSPISLLEIALKVRIGKLPLKRPFGMLFPDELIANDIHLLPIESRHIEPLTTLPFHHNDPFDRLIVATSLAENLKLVSPDAILDAYGVTRLW